MWLPLNLLVIERLTHPFGAGSHHVDSPTVS
jgi:hypothetical protein